jgi:tetratricopeptide (TPR) repeat protein
MIQPSHRAGLPDAAKKISTPSERSHSGHAPPDLVEQFAAAWERGDCPRVEAFLARQAPGAIDDELTVRLIYEEMCLRREAGREMSSEEVRRRFPQWQSQLLMLQDCERLLAPRTASNFPAPGEQVGPFRLLAELGRGALGRVYLAVQPTLSDRPVVVKLTPQTGQEHLSLARLQHTGIVPLYLVQDLPDRELRLLCMPYLGGVTLATLFQRLAALPATPKLGRDLVCILEQQALENAELAPHYGPALQFLERASYTQAVCWIGACLADALHYAHQRGLAHFDVKPSNVLLAGDGQPMLLDFHLARCPLRPGERDQWLGGTPGSMAPEQAAAVAALRAGEPIAAPVDHRADIYALGVLLDELLTHGRQCSDFRLRAVIHRCLAASPERRYSSAAVVALELRRNIPPAATERAASRVGDVLRRHAVPFTLGLAVLAAAITAFAGFEWARLRRLQTVVAEQQARGREQTRDQQMQRLAANLSQVVEQLRWLDTREAIDPQGDRRVDAACRAIWERRRQLLAAGAARDENLSTQVRDDLICLVLLWTDLQIVASHGNEAETPTQGAALLRTAQNDLGDHPLFAYWLQRLTAGEAALPSAIKPWERELLARTLLEEGRLAEANAILTQGVAEAPQDFWLQYSLGCCAQQMGKADEALAAYSACIALAPRRPECRRHRAAVYRALGHANLAALDDEQAQRLASRMGQSD